MDFFGSIGVLMIRLATQPFQLRVTRALFLVFVPLTLAAGVLTVATTTAFGADEGTETVHFEPGDNFIGWVAEPIGVEEVFAAIPEAALIYHWDASSRSWHYAIRDVGGALTALESGMAAMVRIAGDKSAEWERPLTPAKGMVTLYRGVNWVTWVGREDWPLDQVARGIGQSLVSIRVGDETWPAPLDSSIDDLPTLRRGDALQVTVSRDLRWLQPTGMLPTIVPLGDISQSLQEEISSDVQRVVDYFADAHGVETDFSDTTILVFMGVEALLEHQRAGDGPKTKESVERLRGYLGTWGVAGLGQPWGFVVNACIWLDCPHGLGPVGVMAHEWFHYLQVQLPGRGTAHVSPQWIVEGGASWSGNYGVRIADGEMTFEQSRADQTAGAARTSVTLRLAEAKAGPWHYQLGMLAHDLLAVRSGRDAPIEYLRHLHSQSVGPERRWQRSPGWEATFSNVYGLTPSQFYEEFEAWRAELPHQGPRYDYYQGDRTLHGILRAVDGTVTSEFIISAVPYENEVEVGQVRSSSIDEEGHFTLDLKPDTIQRLWFTRDDCTLWLTDNGLTATKPAVGEYRDLDTANLPHLDLKLPAGACRGAIAEVEVLRLRGDDRRVHVSSDSDSVYISGKPQRYGDTYSLSVPHPGRYRVRVRVGGCDLWYAAGGLVVTREEPDPIELGYALVSLKVRVPHDLCVRQIRGRLIDAEGVPITGVWLAAYEGWKYGGAFPDTNGEFSITVPDSGSYQLSFGVDGCRIRYMSSDATTEWHLATPISVNDEDVTGIEFRAPTDPASLCN